MFARTKVVSLFFLSLFLAGGTTAFEVEVSNGLVACKGHEYLSTEAAKRAKIKKKYRNSISLGARYVDLAGKGILNYDALMELVHENESAQHHHFCFRKTETQGGRVSVSDLRSLVKDTTAWINKLANDARNTQEDRTIEITDGGIVTTQHKVYIRYFLLGAALHAIQDSFAHGYRTPTMKQPDESKWASTILREIYGGPEGSKVSKSYRMIDAAVDYIGPVQGAKHHNAVYTASTSSEFWSDKVWNAYECTVVKNHLGNLVPHAFAAYLASVDFLRTFENNQPIEKFFERWFKVAGENYPGMGDPEGKCSTRHCPSMNIPGESR